MGFLAGLCMCGAHEVQIIAGGWVLPVGLWLMPSRCDCLVFVACLALALGHWSMEASTMFLREVLCELCCTLRSHVPQTQGSEDVAAVCRSAVCQEKLDQTLNKLRAVLPPEMAQHLPPASVPPAERAQEIEALGRAAHAAVDGKPPAFAVNFTCDGLPDMQLLMFYFGQGMLTALRPCFLCMVVRGVGS